MIHVEDKTIILPDGRTLAYADNGNTSSTSMVLFLHGAFSVGDASRMPQALLEHNVHFIAPSLPGWGKSSALPSSTPSAISSSYARTLAADITCLITHLHPTHPTRLKLHLCGHSFGSVPAQILYGLPASIFPFAGQIVSLVLLAPLSPPHVHKSYSRSLSWPSYLFFGPPARYTPSFIHGFFLYIARLYMARHVPWLVSESAAQKHIQKIVIDAMDEDGREVFTRWQEDNEVCEMQFVREAAQVLVRSVAHSWQGFFDIPVIYHYGWLEWPPSTVTGSENAANNCPIVVVASTGDMMSSEGMARWLACSYKSVAFKSIDGNHYSILLHLEDIWREIFRAQAGPSSASSLI